MEIEEVGLKWVLLEFSSLLKLQQSLLDILGMKLDILGKIQGIGHIIWTDIK
jgi:hypothetical protein